MKTPLKWDSDYCNEVIKIFFKDFEEINSVNEKTKQPFGLLHGGASCVLAESVASFATALTLDLTKQIPVGLSLNANHLKSATSGFVYAKATSKHLGKTTSLWDVIVTNEDKEIVSSVVFTAFHKDIK